MIAISQQLMVTGPAKTCNRIIVLAFSTQIDTLVYFKYWAEHDRIGFTGLTWNLLTICWFSFLNTSYCCGFRCSNLWGCVRFQGFCFLLYLLALIGKCFLEFLWRIILENNRHCDPSLSLFCNNMKNWHSWLDCEN